MNYLVTGPGCEGRRVPASDGAAMTFAQNQAVKAKTPGTWYVREETGEIIAHVTREESGVVLTRRVEREAAPRKSEAAPTMTLEEAA